MALANAEKELVAYADRLAAQSDFLARLQKRLRIARPPRRIECFDNSNMQGSYPVSSCVVFKNAKPSKKDYRHYNIKTVVGPDDFASMREVVHRRYRRLLEEGESLPQLIIIDGGKGQLSAAVESLKTLGILEKVTIVGIAKRLEEIALSDPYFIDKKLYPNVDFYSGIILKALDMPLNMFTVIFAMARTAGWISQWMEMMEDQEQRIGRPRQIYTGAQTRDFVPRDKR